MTDQPTTRRRRRSTREGVNGEQTEADPASLAKEACLRSLTIKARTRHELLSMLARKGFEEDVATGVVDRLAELSLIDDEQFARDWVEQRRRYQHRSSRALREELRSKGVDRDAVAAAMADVGDDGDLDAAVALVEKRLRTSRDEDPAVMGRRLLALLARRGFSAETAQQALRRCLAHDGEAPEFSG